MLPQLRSRPCRENPDSADRGSGSSQLIQGQLSIMTALGDSLRKVRQEPAGCPNGSVMSCNTAGGSSMGNQQLQVPAFQVTGGPGTADGAEYMLFSCIVLVLFVHEVFPRCEDEKEEEKG